MRKKDGVLIGIVLIIAFVTMMIYHFGLKELGSVVVITVNGKEYKRLPLEEESSLKIPSEAGGFNLLVIENGYADIKDASCPDLRCVHQRKIRYNGETLVCLPNKVVVTIESHEQSEVDAVGK